MGQDRILITGGSGQVGTELILALREAHGGDNVIVTDVKAPNYDVANGGPFEILNILEKERLAALMDQYQINVVYHLASILSAKGEQNPEFAWDVNMNGLLNVLSLSNLKHVDKVFWPSSIAVFGPNSPKKLTPQFTIMDPDTVYGVSKQAGERWCHYYNEVKGLDVRSLRYPGLISYKTPAGGGTTDYAVDIYFDALEKKRFECFLEEDTVLPMMYMDDAINATLQLMDAPEEIITIRSSYNIAGCSFSPEQVSQEIKKHIPEFHITYKPDYRQKIAESWPESIDDEYARREWGWIPAFDLEKMTDEMLKNIRATMAVDQS